MPILSVLASEVPPGPLPASYRGEFEIDILHFEEAAVLPLRQGASFEDGSHRIVINQMRTPARGPVVRATTSMATSSLDRRSPPTYTYFLRNRAAGEALAGTLRRWSFPPTPSQFFVGRYAVLGSAFGFTVGSGELEFPSRTSVQLASALAPDRTDQWTDDQWLQGAELVIVRTVDHGTVRRQLELTGLTVNAR
jgi:hypothetical protein